MITVTEKMLTHKKKQIHYILYYSKSLISYLHLVDSMLRRFS